MEHVSAQLTEGEFIDMGFHYGVMVDTHPFRTVRHRTAEARVGYFVGGRYLFRDGPSAAAVIEDSHPKRLKRTTVALSSKRTCGGSLSSAITNYLRLNAPEFMRSRWSFRRSGG